MSRLEGFDVSTYQVPGAYPPGMAFAWVRLTYGGGNDARSLQHVTALRRLGLVIGGYHFGVGGAQDSVVDQANRFLRRAKEVGGVDLLALDLESNRVGPSMTDDEADAFIRQIQTAGRRIGLYHSRSGFPELHFNFRWVADYTLMARGLGRPLIAKAWTFWQYTSSGAIVGDRDRFNGNEAALAALVKASHV